MRSGRREKEIKSAQPAADSRGWSARYRAVPEGPPRAAGRPVGDGSCRCPRGGGPLRPTTDDRHGGGRADARGSGRLSTEQEQQIKSQLRTIRMVNGRLTRIFWEHEKLKHYIGGTTAWRTAQGGGWGRGRRGKMGGGGGGGEEGSGCSSFSSSPSWCSSPPASPLPGVVGGGGCGGTRTQRPFSTPPSAPLSHSPPADPPPLA